MCCLGRLWRRQRCSTHGPICWGRAAITSAQTSITACAPMGCSHSWRFLRSTWKWRSCTAATSTSSPSLTFAPTPQVRAHACFLLHHFEATSTSELRHIWLSPRTESALQMWAPSPQVFPCFLSPPSFGALIWNAPFSTACCGRGSSWRSLLKDTISAEDVCCLLPGLECADRMSTDFWGNILRLNVAHLMLVQRAT